jgi:hypothetical protein
VIVNNNVSKAKWIKYYEGTEYNIADSEIKIEK